jgi:predicted secreted protein
MEIPAKVALKVGERWSVRLPGLGSAGYQWTWELQQGVGVVAVSLAPAPLPATQPAGGEPPGTSSVDEVVEVRALRPGEAVLHFVQRRPWQADQAPYRQHVVEVAVVA